MKKHLHLTLLTALCLAVSLLFASCGDNPTQEITTTDESGSTTTSPTTTLRTLDSYAIVRPSAGSKELIAACSEWFASLRAAGNTTMSLSEDWVKGIKQGETVTNSDPEILIGETNRAESVSALAELSGSQDYMIRLTDNKLVIVGKCDAATLRALSYVRENYVDEGGHICVPENLSIHYKLAAPDSPLSRLMQDYTVVRGDKMTGAYTILGLKTLRESLADMAGGTIKVTTDATPESGTYEILLGATNRAESKKFSEGLGCMDYTIGMTDNKIVIWGGTPVATLRAIDKFLAMVADGELTSLSADTLSYTEKFWDVYSISPLTSPTAAFTPNWSKIFTAPDWMHDFEEKTYAITQNSLRNMSVAHRGDWAYYPEDSLESFLSAIAAGCDVIETDVRETRDHVLVLMHDETLGRTTDWSSKKGKNGLPTSDKLSDWTYAELMQLTLKTKDGSATKYKIPTLYEALLVMKDRCFVLLDKKETKFTLDEIALPMARDLGCAEIFFYDTGLANMKKWKAQMPEDQDLAAYLARCEEYLKTGALRKRYWCDPNSPTTVAKETEAVFKAYREEGKTLLWANRIVAYCQYIAANFTAAK